jgi:hypothetical protein
MMGSISVRGLEKGEGRNSAGTAREDSSVLEDEKKNLQRQKTR